MEHYKDLIIKLDPVYKTLIGVAILIPLIFGIFSWPTFIFIVAPIMLKLYAKYTCGKTNSSRRIDGQVVIVTGANSGLGLETSKQLAKRGGKVILACRNIERGKKAADEIKKDIPNAEVTVMKLDLASMKSIREFVKKFLSEQTRLDILINNAGGITQEKIITEDGLETNFAGNFLGPFLLTNLLLDVMRKTGKARIINVSGFLYQVPRELDLDNLTSEKPGFNPTLTAMRAALGKILFTRELDRRIRSAKIIGLTVNVLHPGIIKTPATDSFTEAWYLAIFMKIAELFSKSLEEGVQTQIHLAVAEEVEELSGKYWVDCAESSVSRLAQDMKLAKGLWEKSASLVKLTPEETIF